MKKWAKFWARLVDADYFVLRRNGFHPRRILTQIGFGFQGINGEGSRPIAAWAAYRALEGIFCWKGGYA